jgi:hypothetical protein
VKAVSATTSSRSSRRINTLFEAAEFEHRIMPVPVRALSSNQREDKGLSADAVEAVLRSPRRDPRTETIARMPIRED